MSAQHGREGASRKAYVVSVKPGFSVSMKLKAAFSERALQAPVKVEGRERV